MAPPLPNAAHCLKRSYRVSRSCSHGWFLSGGLEPAGGQTQETPPPLSVLCNPGHDPRTRSDPHLRAILPCPVLSVPLSLDVHPAHLQTKHVNRVETQGLVCEMRPFHERACRQAGCQMPEMWQGLRDLPGSVSRPVPPNDHEYHPCHPSFQPLQTDDGDTTADYTSQDGTTAYDTTAYDVTSYDTATYDSVPLASNAASYASITYITSDYPSAESMADYTAPAYTTTMMTTMATYTAAPSATASYTAEGPEYVQADYATTGYATPASGHAVYYPASAQAHAGHAPPPSEGSEDPLPSP